jgi:hypothetical protein
MPAVSKLITDIMLHNKWRKYVCSSFQKNETISSLGDMRQPKFVSIAKIVL